MGREDPQWYIYTGLWNKSATKPVCRLLSSHTITQFIDFKQCTLYVNIYGRIKVLAKEKIKEPQQMNFIHTF